MLIVEKEGILNSTCDQAVAAMKKINNNNNINGYQCIGFTCPDWIKDTLKNAQNDNLSNSQIAKLQKDKSLCDMIYQINSNQNDIEEKWSYVTKESLIKTINNKLNNCSILNVEYNIQKCEYCSIISDSTFETRPCHSRQEFYHKRGNKIHPTVQRVHTANVSRRETMWKTNLAKPKNWAKIALRGSNVKVSYKYDCCNQDQNSHGCKLKCTKCQAIGGDNLSVTNGCITLCANCNKDVHATIGCLVRCEECHQQWGNQHA